MAANVVCSVCGGDSDNGRWRRVTDGSLSRMAEMASESETREILPLRDFDRAPVAVGDVLCEREGCLYSMFVKDETQSKRQTKTRASKNPLWSSPDPELLAKRVRLDRYCSSEASVLALLARVEIAGVILDICGGAMDSVATTMGGRVRVVTNDINPRVPADYHEDCCNEEFISKYRADPGRPPPDWVVTSPPYKDAIKYVRTALALCSTGVALKLPLSFLEPCTDRGDWLAENAPSVCVFLQRQVYAYGCPQSGEFWGVWYKDRGNYSTAVAAGSTQIFFSS